MSILSRDGRRNREEQGLGASINPSNKSNMHHFTWAQDCHNQGKWERRIWVSHSLAAPEERMGKHG